MKKILPNKISNQNQESNFFNNINDEKLKETIIFMTSKNLLKLKYNLKFETYLELEQYIKEEIGSFLNEKYNDIHEKVSEIRKVGKEATVVTFKLMTIPLKIKMCLATCEKKDIEKVLSIIEYIEKEINKKSSQN